VLVIACPCALGLATPLAMTVAVGRATREGILFRSAAAVETLSTCDAVAFDKTGTLTVGFPRIVESGLMPGCEQRGIGGAADLVRLVAAVESAAGHAIGRAFAVAAGAQARPIGAVETSLPPAQDVVLTPGRGAAGRVAGRSVLVGSRAFLAERGVPLDCDGLRPVEEALARAGSEGRTLVLVAVDGHAAGWFGLEDAARAEAASVVRQLQSMGLAVSMLSGDTPEAAARIGLAAGIRDARGGLLPAEKLALIEAWQREGRRVAFVGDGVNDAPALAAAATGVAMGTGADVAIETADVTLLARGLEPLPTAVTLARRTMVVVRQNLWLAVVYNVLAIPVAAGLLSSLVGPAMGPMAAAAAMAASSLSVIANSLRLERGIDRQPPSAQGSYNAPGSGTTRPS